MRGARQSVVEELKELGYSPRCDRNGNIVIQDDGETLHVLFFNYEDVMDVADDDAPVDVADSEEDRDGEDEGGNEAEGWYFEDDYNFFHFFWESPLFTKDDLHSLIALVNDICSDLHLVKAYIEEIGPGKGFVVVCCVETLIDLSTLSTCLEDYIDLLMDAVHSVKILKDELSAEPSCLPER